jgi:hypothetical protein
MSERSDLIFWMHAGASGCTQQVVTIDKGAKKETQPTEEKHAGDRTLNQGASAAGNTCRPEALASNTRAVHITLTLHESHTQFPVGNSKKQPPFDSHRACICDVAQGTKVPHDGPIEVPNASTLVGIKAVTRVQMALVCQVLAPATHSGSSAPRRLGRKDGSWRHPAKWGRGAGDMPLQCRLGLTDGQQLQRQRERN